MNIEFRLDQHSIRPREQVVELWYGNQLVGQITSGDGRTIRVLTKYSLRTEIISDRDRIAPIQVTELTIGV
jgi:hypothetical protein